MHNKHKYYYKHSKSIKVNKYRILQYLCCIERQRFLKCVQINQMDDTDTDIMRGRGGPLICVDYYFYWGLFVWAGQTYVTRIILIPKYLGDLQVSKTETKSSSSKRRVWGLSREWRGLTDVKSDSWLETS